MSKVYGGKNGVRIRFRVQETPETRFQGVYNIASRTNPAFRNIENILSNYPFKMLPLRYRELNCLPKLSNIIYAFLVGNEFILPRQKEFSELQVNHATHGCPYMPVGKRRILPDHFKLLSNFFVFYFEQ